jgi:hypothetical protein
MLVLALLIVSQLGLSFCFGNFIGGIGSTMTGSPREGIKFAGRMVMAIWAILNGLLLVLAFLAAGIHLPLVAVALLAFILNFLFYALGGRTSSGA